jgi:hypothetical protein
MSPRDPSGDLGKMIASTPILRDASAQDRISMARKSFFGNLVLVEITTCLMGVYIECLFLAGQLDLADSKMCLLVLAAGNLFNVGVYYLFLRIACKRPKVDSIKSNNSEL